MKQITARFAGRCSECGGRIRAGEQILWAKGASSHVDCSKAKAADAPQSSRKANTTGKVALVGTREGAVHELQTRLNMRKSTAPDLRVGYVFRVGPHAGPVAGQIVTVVGSEAVWTHEDWEEDCGQPGIGSGWWVYEFVRPATDDEAAPVLAAEQESANKAAAEKAQKEAKIEHYRTELETRTAGMLCTSWLRSPAHLTRVAELSDKGCSATLSVGDFDDGEPAVVEWKCYFDDHRDYVWAAPAFVERKLREKAAEIGVDERKALEWLASSAGCHGEELYRLIAGFDWELEGAEVRRMASERLGNKDAKEGFGGCQS